jgi:hypothetical protein
MKIFKKTRRAENATLTEIGLLLFIAQNTDVSGLYQYPDSETADAVDSTRPTVHRLRNRLIANGYLTVRIPRKWLGEKGWSEVNVAISPKGLKALLLSTKMSQATILAQKTTDPGSNEHITTNPITCRIDDSDLKDKRVKVEGADEPGSLYTVQLVERTVRQVLDSIEHRREMWELAAPHRRAMADLVASHWARVILPAPVVTEQDQEQSTMTTMITSGMIITPGTCEYSLPSCQCGDDVAYIAHPLGDDRFQVFPKQKCESCTERTRSTERLRAREEAEREYDRQLKAGTNRPPLRDNDYVTEADCVVLGGHVDLSDIRVAGLDKCECGRRVYYELNKDEKGRYVSIASICVECLQAQCTPVNPPVTQAETGSREA